ncbi:SDR family oxidoreductase [Paraburkholderia phosphatilytica]|uniref:SDR family oxidoreductase n=1 Tax=Paraburkholderia phosphatilytica TaxID=2282883 RepID=UPI000E4ADF2C|nr:SDR family oxidoreductase [Paraburkholderia phosphatilytica]
MDGVRAETAGETRDALNARGEFAGKTVLVTGAGKGIGRASALLLAERGAHVVALSRQRADLDSLRELTHCEALAVDLADIAATHAAIASATPADFVVNCAGIVERQAFLDTSADTFDRTLAVNTRAPLLVAQQCARGMIERGVRGAIVNVSSIAAQVGTPLHAAYCASKAALDALTRVMAVELGAYGIRVNSVNPVVTLTPMAEKVWSDPARSAPMLARIPLQRFAQPDDVAEAIAWLLGDGARMVNGTTLTVDGGFRAG